MGRALLITLAVLIYIIAGIHLVAHIFFLYWTFSWLDSVMHTLAGVWIGLGTVWLIYHSPYREKLQSLCRLQVYRTTIGRDMLIVLGTAFVLGTAWEFYQVSGHIFFEIPFKSDHLADSITDVLFGVMGAGIGLGVYRLLFARQNSPELEGDAIR